MSIYRVSTNLDQLKNLPAEYDYLYYNYKWFAPFPDILNRASFETESIEEAKLMYDALHRLKIKPVFRNWF